MDSCTEYDHHGDADVDALQLGLLLLQGLLLLLLRLDSLVGLHIHRLKPIKGKHICVTCKAKE